MGRNLMSRKNQHRTIEVAIETVKRQLNAPENAELLAKLPKATRPEKIHRPRRPRSEWPSMSLADLRPGSAIYEIERQRLAPAATLPRAPLGAAARSPRSRLRPVPTRPRARSCPMPGITTSFAPGIAAAVASPPETPIRGSSSPWITTVGTRISAKRSVRSPERMIAIVWRTVPLG